MSGVVADHAVQLLECVSRTRRRRSEQWGRVRMREEGGTEAGDDGGGRAWAEMERCVRRRRPQTTAVTVSAHRLALHTARLHHLNPSHDACSASDHHRIQPTSSVGLSSSTSPSLRTSLTFTFSQLADSSSSCSPHHAGQLACPACAHSATSVDAAPLTLPASPVFLACSCLRRVSPT